MAFVVLYDACVLYPAPLRDLLIRIASTGIVRARRSDAILDECFRTILKQRPDLKLEAIDRTRDLMKRAVPDCLVTGFEALIDGLTLPDPDDRHVLAAAIRADAQAIVTFNLRDFPADKLAPYNVQARHPDDFVLDTIGLSPGLVTKILGEQAGALENPPRTVGELLDTLRDVYANVRRPIVHSLNLAHLMPLSAVWAGDPKNAHLEQVSGVGDTHVTCSTTGATPVRLHLAVGEVGHTIVLGSTGAGKSTLLGLLALQWLRYPNAQVIVFDKDRSARAATLAVGGRCYEPRSDKARVGFQPLARIDEPAEPTLRRSAS